jgi:RNA polymerase-binding transcription factor DksA
MEKELSLARNAGDLLAQVEEALGRLADGVYGICAGCGKGIPVTRLDARPHTKLCVDCANNHR